MYCLRCAAGEKLLWVSSALHVATAVHCMVRSHIELRAVCALHALCYSSSAIVLRTEFATSEMKVQGCDFRNGAQRLQCTKKISRRQDFCSVWCEMCKISAQCLQRITQRMALQKCDSEWYCATAGMKVRAIFCCRAIHAQDFKYCWDIWAVSCRHFHVYILAGHLVSVAKCLTTTCFERQQQQSVGSMWSHH